MTKQDTEVVFNERKIPEADPLILYPYEFIQCELTDEFKNSRRKRIYETSSSTIGWDIAQVEAYLDAYFMNYFNGVLYQTIHAIHKYGEFDICQFLKANIYAERFYAVKSAGNVFGSDLYSVFPVKNSSMTSEIIIQVIKYLKNKGFIDTNYPDI